MRSILVRLWRTDPEFRHGLRLMAGLPYMVYVMYRFDEIDALLDTIRWRPIAGPNVSARSVRVASKATKTKRGD